MSKYPNAVQCLECEKILVSFNRHDYKVCGCPNNTMVDGGHDYFRAGGVDLSKVQPLRIVRAPKITGGKKK